MAKSVESKKEKKEAKVVASGSESSSDSSSASGSGSESSSSDSESSSSDSESEEEKKEEKKEEASSDSSDSSSDEEEEEEKKEEKKDESSDSSDSSSDEEEEKEEESKKRKAEDEETETPEPEAKKAKTSEPATLFVGRLSWNVDSEWLASVFEKYEGVSNARVITERDTGRSKGFGYVDFESKEEAEKALNELQGTDLDGREINLDFSNAKPKRDNVSRDRAKTYGDVKSDPSDTLFIGNLSFDVNNGAVTDFFSEFNPIGCRLPTRPGTEELKGFGYVQFGSVDDAKSALEKLNGSSLYNRSVRLDFSSPRPPRDDSRGGDRGFGGNRGGDRGFGGNRGGFGGRDRGSGANNTPVREREFRGNKTTFD